MTKNFVEPEYEKKGFTCFNCGTYSNHDWDKTRVNYTRGVTHSFSQNDDIRILSICRCQQCGFISYWLEGQLMWPLKSNVDLPVDEMPEDIKELYNEARNIFYLSPKGACAILRLGLQKLCNRLAEKPEDAKIDEAIKDLVANGLPSTLQKSMDTIRVIGNEAVHPGQINVDDNKQIASALFKLMNIIVEKMVIEPKEIDDIYNLLPQSKIDGINRRDGRKTTETVGNK